MHRHLLLLSEPTLCTLHGILNRVSHFLHRSLHLVHSDIGIQIFQDIFYRALLRYIALDIRLLHLLGISTTTDKLGEDVFRSLCGQMSISEGLILNLHLILEETCQLAVCFFRELRNTVLDSKIQFTDIRQLLIARCGHTECVFEAISYSWVTLQEVFQALGQS